MWWKFFESISYDGLNFWKRIIYTIVNLQTYILKETVKFNIVFNGLGYTYIYIYTTSDFTLFENIKQKQNKTKIT